MKYCEKCGLEKHPEFKLEGCLNCENGKPQRKFKKLRTYKFDEE